MSSPKVSILVPIFNVEQYLKQCLDSLVSQTLKDIEIICINDGSTDSSRKIIEEYAAADPRFVVINKKNSGYGDSMNKGLAKATGEYVGIVESDDWAELDMFESLYRLAKKNDDVDVVKSNFYNYFSDPEKAKTNNNVIGVLRHEEANRLINPAEAQHIFYQQPSIWSAIYRRDFLAEHDIDFLPTPGASYQDAGFNFKVWAATERAFYTTGAYLHYRQDNENSSINSPGKVFCISDEYAEIERWLRKHNLLDKFGELMEVTKWGGYSWNIERLTAKLAEDFIRLASKEYNDARQQGLLDLERFDINQTRILTEMMEDPEITIKRKYAIEAAKVSVVVPVYNIEGYLQECLDSIIGQTLKKIEIICIDDGSIDDSATILEEYYQRDPRISIISQPNSGLSAARNRGINRAHAHYIMFCDSDDYYEPEMCEKMYEAISRPKIDIAICGVTIVYEEENYTALAKNGDTQYYAVKFDGKQQITDSKLKKIDVSAWNKIYKMSILNEHDIRFPEGLKYEDAYFFNAYMLFGRNAFFLPNDHLYHYRRRAGSIMSQTFTASSPFAHDHIEVVVHLFDFMKRNGVAAEHLDYYGELFARSFYFALRNLPQRHHERLYHTVQEFIKANGRYINSINPHVVDQMNMLIPKVTLRSKVERKVKILFAGKILPRVSLSYRAQRRIMAAIDDLSYTVSRLNDNNTARINEIAATLEDLKNTSKK